MWLKLAEQPRGGLELLRREVLVAHHQYVTFRKGTVESSARLIVDRPSEVESDDFRARVIRKPPDGKRGHGRSSTGIGLAAFVERTLWNVARHAALMLAVRM